MKTICLLFVFMGLFTSARSEVNSSNDVLFPTNERGLETSHFGFGVDVGSSIDLTSNNLSTFDADLILGYKNKLFRIIGAGVGLHRAFGSENNFVPVYGIIRTSFTTKPSRFFLNLTGGYCFNTLSSSSKSGGMTLSAGLGIKLAESSKFSSHIILSYGYMHLSHISDISPAMINEDISSARLTIGIGF